MREASKAPLSHTRTHAADAVTGQRQGWEITVGMWSYRCPACTLALCVRIQPGAVAGRLQRCGWDFEKSYGLRVCGALERSLTLPRPSLTLIFFMYVCRCYRCPCVQLVIGATCETVVKSLLRMGDQQKGLWCNEGFNYAPAHG